MHRPPCKTLAVAVLLAIASCGKGPPSAGGDPSARSGQDPDAAAYRLPTFQRVRADVVQLERMVASSPEDASARLALARKLIEGGIHSRAEEQLARAIELDPALDGATLLLVERLLFRGDAARALARADAALAVAPSAELHAQRGRCLVLVDPERPERAEEAFREALRLDGRSVTACYELGRLRLRAGDAEEAVALLERATTLRPNHLGAHFNLARALDAAGRAEEASKAREAHRRLAVLEDMGHLDDPGSLEAYLAVAQVFLDGGDGERALRELDAARTAYPRQSVVGVKRALALSRLKRADEAREAFDAALRAHPKDANVLNQYAWWLATAADDPESHRRAVTLAERAAKVTRRGDPNILDTLAEARARVGDHAGAAAAVREALQLRPGDPALVRRRDEFARRAEDGR